MCCRERRPVFLVLLVQAALVSAGALLGGAWGLAGETSWRAGKDFWRQLELPVGIEWSSTTLRPAMQTLARNQGVFIWIDRRIDPGYEVQFVSDGVSLDAALRRFAASFGAGVGYMDSVAYLGPRDAASKLATLVALRSEEVRKAPAAAGNAWLDRRPWQWDELAVPRELLARLASETGFTIKGLEQVPHDLWPAADLPALSAVERLSLVLVGFELTFEFDSDFQEIRLVPLPRTATLVRNYAHRGDLARVVQELAQVFPHVQVTRSGASLIVSGSYEDHVLVERWLRGERVAVAGQTRYTLRVANQPLGAVLKALGPRLALTLEIDPRVTPKLEQLISFAVENATQEELLNAVFRNTGVRPSVVGDTLRLIPGE